jgi:hypothetical protein
MYLSGFTSEWLKHVSDVNGQTILCRWMFLKICNCDCLSSGIRSVVVVVVVVLDDWRRGLTWTGFDHKRKVIELRRWKVWEQTTSITFSVKSSRAWIIQWNQQGSRLLMLLFPASHWLETLGSFEARNQSRLSYSRNCFLLDIRSEIIRSASLSYIHSRPVRY